MGKTLISLIGGLSGMIGWGTSDFLASFTSEKFGHRKTLFWSQIAGISLMGAAVLAFTRNFTLNASLLTTLIIGGMTYTLGYLFFYKAFEIGNVSVVSSVINIQNIFVILIAHFIFHQQLTSLQIPAIILVLIGITLVSVNFKDLKSGSKGLIVGVKETLLAAIFFGMFFWPINEFNSERADWIFVSFTTKFVAILFLVLIAYVQKFSLKIALSSKKEKITLAGVGLLEALAVLGVSFGVSYGDSIIVAPISSALTIVTITLAVIFLKERITKIQALGIILTIFGIILTAF